MLKVISFVVFLFYASSCFANECYLYDPDGGIFSIWNGPCLNEMAEGYGSAISEDGSTSFVGGAKGGQAHGKATIKSPHNVFIGYFNKGNRMTGEMIFSSGKIFKGSFRHQVPYEGVVFDAKGNVLRSGKFKRAGNIAVPDYDPNLFTLIGGLAFIVFVAATGVVLTGVAAQAALASTPRLLFIVAVPK